MAARIHRAETVGGASGEPFDKGIALAPGLEGFLDGIGLLMGSCSHRVALLYANLIVLLRASDPTET